MRRKKNWNIFRRLKKGDKTSSLITRSSFLLSAFCFLLSAFSLLALTSCDKEERLIGSWRLQTVLMNNEPLNDSLQENVIPKLTQYHFFYSNSLSISTYDFTLDKPISSPEGFYYFINRSQLRMEYTLLFRHYVITADIKKLTNKELHLEYEDKGNRYFLELYAIQY